MKSSFIKIVLLISAIALGQQENSILTAPDNWRSEVIPFPLSFAPDIDFVGFEEIRFAPGWSDSSSEEFWTYSFVWYIEGASPLTERSLTEAMNLYYDGLMSAVAKNQPEIEEPITIAKTLSLFIKTDEGFIGKMNVFDAFFTKNRIALNIKVNESFCDRTNKKVVLFDIAPKPFDDEIWKNFNNIKVNVDCH